MHIAAILAIIKQLNPVRGEAIKTLLELLRKKNK